MKILDEINKGLLKSHPLGDFTEDKDFNRVTDWISTGNLNLNMSISGSFFKGIPNNRITALAGESGVGKTFLLLNIVKNALEKGYTVYIFDSEGAISDDLIESFGIFDYWTGGGNKSLYENELIIVPVSIIEDLRSMMMGVIEKLQALYKAGKELPKIMFGLDSLGNLGSRKEYTDAVSGSEKADMTTAKISRSIFRLITLPCTILKIPVVFTNHTYEGMDMFNPDPKMAKGAGAVYAASNIVFLQKFSLKDDDAKTKVGIKVLARPLKNRFVTPMTVTFHINFTTGMNQYIGLETYFGPDENQLRWDDCGIERGKMEDEIKELPVLDDDGNPVLVKATNEVKLKKQKTGEIIFVPNNNKTGPFCVKHLNKRITKSSEFFTSEVFTQEVLNKMEEKIAPLYAYSKAEENNDIDKENQEE